MRLVIIHKDSGLPQQENLLRFAVSHRPLADIVLEGLAVESCWSDRPSTVVALPQEWAQRLLDDKRWIKYDGQGINLGMWARPGNKSADNRWFIVSNGRFATRVDHTWWESILAGLDAEVICLKINPELKAYREKVRLTSQGAVAGFRRTYEDSAQAGPVPGDWPHHVLIRNDALIDLTADSTLPIEFDEFKARCKEKSLTIKGVEVAGAVLDLQSTAGLLAFCRINLRSVGKKRFIKQSITNKQNVTIAQGARLLGEVVLGRNVHIDRDAVVLGPAVLADDVKIERAVMIRSCIIGPEVKVDKNRILENRIIAGAPLDGQSVPRGELDRLERLYCAQSDSAQAKGENHGFRYWPRFSYVHCIKRIADIIMAILVLLLFAPVLPILALVVKLNSPGPVFFKDRRQGRYGREFYCIKFRSMITGADAMQDNLRSINEVDGPQFKMDDDPRVSSVGQFLRSTYLDEIPQFFNVLLGQMSVVGPRPSPEAENSLCPGWRDARLSVRPGITGLWQVSRTRQWGQDFQEWLYFDMEYIKNLSLRMDLLICWKTIKYLIRQFIKQF